MKSKKILWVVLAALLLICLALANLEDMGLFIFDTDRRINVNAD